MKKLILLCCVPFLFWTCSTKLDILDDWKETTIVYGLLDQNSPVQYIRIQKAFLGPDNALTMAQQFDSINYINQLTVYVQGWYNNSLMQTFALQPDTFTNKDAGIFAGPNQVVYSFNTPPGTLNSAYDYKLIVTNSATGNTVTATTDLVESSTTSVFNISQPSTGNPQVSFEPTTSSPEFTLKWKAAPSARVYQPSLRLYYTEFYANGDSLHTATHEWTLAMLTTNEVTANSEQSVKFDKMSFYRFVGGDIPSNPNVVRRRADYVEINVYAANEEMKNYIDINGASNSISQEHPLYTNIVNSDPTIPAYGIFASRTRAVKPNTGGNYTWLLTKNSIDGNTLGFKGLVSDPSTCFLLFEKWDHSTPPGCQ